MSNNKNLGTVLYSLPINVTVPENTKAQVTQSVSLHKGTYLFSGGTSIPSPTHFMESVWTTYLQKHILELIVMIYSVVLVLTKLIIILWHSYSYRRDSVNHN